MSMRLDAETDRRIDELARRRRVSRSAVVRAAVAALAEQEKGADTPFAAIEHLVGCVQGGPTNLSKQTGERFRELLKRRKTRR